MRRKREWERNLKRRLEPRVVITASILIGTHFKNWMKKERKKERVIESGRVN